MRELMIADLLDTLRALLRELGDTNYIEYGVPSDPTEYHSYIRIRKIPCFGTLKYRVTLLHTGIEGSGMYYELGDEQALANAVMKHVLHYHRPMFKVSREIQAKLDELKRKSELAFFLRKETRQSKPQELLVEVSSGLSTHSEVRTFLGIANSGRPLGGNDA